MASAAIYQAIRDHITALWKLSPVAFENENADQDGNALPPNPKRIFVEIELTGTVYGMQSLGAVPLSTNRWDEEGILFVNVNIPNGEGSYQGRLIAKQFIDLFRGLLLLNDSLEFWDAGIGAGRGGVIDGNWFMIPAHIRWRRVDAPIDGLE